MVFTDIAINHWVERLRWPVWAMTVSYALSWYIFYKTLFRQTNGGNALKSSLLQSKRNALTAIHVGSGLYDTNVLSCVFRLVAKRSILGFGFSSENILLNIFSLSFHSVWTSFFQDSSFTSVFCIPGICVAESQFPFSCAQFRICLDRMSHFPE